ncbi:hypothetical protein ACOMHN_036147 [Nucella lapillus]
MYRDFSNTAKTMKKCVHTLDCSDDVIASATVTDKLITGLDYVAVTHIEEELAQISELHVLHFHENKITLSNDGLTTERMDRDALDGVGVSRDPMIVNRLIEVNIDAINSSYSSTYGGVVTCNPDAFHIHPYVLWTDSSNVVCEGWCRQSIWSAAV